MQRESANLANPFRDDVCHREQLLGMFIEKQMIVTEVMAAHMPVEIFRFHVQREYICKDGVHRARDVFRRFRRKIGSSFQWSFASMQQLFPSRIRFSQISAVV